MGHYDDLYEFYKDKPIPPFGLKVFKRESKKETKRGKKMLDPFVNDQSLNNELKDAWKEIEELKKEREALKLECAQLKNERDTFIKENNTLKRELSRYLDGE